MGNRLRLQIELELILGNKNVYFNPPENLKMDYPCIRYEMSNINTTHADNTAYINNKQYTITLIHNDPDTKIVNDLLSMKHTSFDRSYTSDNLYHFVFSRYY